MNSTRTKLKLLDLERASGNVAIGKGGGGGTTNGGVGSSSSIRSINRYGVGGSLMAPKREPGGQRAASKAKGELARERESNQTIAPALHDSRCFSTRWNLGSRTSLSSILF